MAKTSGHGNARWTRDETILALNLYFACKGRVPDADDSRVIELSRVLRSLPLHAGNSKRPTLRNPDGVAFKLQNLRQVATGKGLGHVSHTDRAVWEELSGDPARVRDLARLILTGAKELEAPNGGGGGGEDEEFAEGRIATRMHHRRERAKGVRPSLLKHRRARGLLTCEICALTEKGLPSEIADALFEAHHIIPVSQLGETKTRLKDLALLCACCHRLIHRAISRERRWVTIDESRSLWGMVGRLNSQIERQVADIS